MGSKTPDEHRQGPDGMVRCTMMRQKTAYTSTGSSANAVASIVNPPKSAAASGLLDGALEGQDEDGDEDDDEKSGADLNTGAKQDGQHEP
jgi:methionyl aminopeptidase